MRLVSVTLFIQSAVLVSTAAAVPLAAHAQGCDAAAHPAAKVQVGAAAAPDVYRTRAVQRDPFSGRMFALLENCAHPSQPWLATPSAEAGHLSLPLLQHTAPTPPMIEAGMRVRVRAASARVAAYGSGVALEPASAGARLRVRLDNALHPGSFGPVVQATAVGAGEVDWVW